MGIPGGSGEDPSQPNVLLFTHLFTLGFVLIGRLVAAILYGVTTLQTSVYYMHFSGDTSTIKFFVGAIWILDTLHAAFMCHTLYYYLITNYGVPTSLEYDVWSFPASLLVNLFVVIAVQCFFAHKIYYLCRPRAKWLITAPIVNTFTLEGNVSSSDMAAIDPNFASSLWVWHGFVLFFHHDSRLIKMQRWPFYCTSTFATLPTEMLIFLCSLVNEEASVIRQIRFYAATPFAATLWHSLCLLKMTSVRVDGSYPTTPLSTKRLLTMLIIYAVNRCLLVLIVALAEFVTTVELQNAWSTGLDFTIGKLYANSLLASLNTRQHLRSRGSTTKLNEGIHVVHFTNMPKLSEGIKGSQDGERRVDVHEGAVMPMWRLI
ncbi:hypothetical protein F5141DRAFT_1293292 [Pisolithus sp. B1]|nr:hypothetical protein F5141DRAFT_1293292 [Pisolithus sp. B1]